VRIQLRGIGASLRQGVVKVVKQIDTLAGEWPAATNYLYLTNAGETDDDTGPGVDALVIGAGVFRIGVSVEFDWSVVNTVLGLREMGYRLGLLTITRRQ